MPMEDICNFISEDSENTGLHFRHFVYEASYRRLRQPFIGTNYCAHLAFLGKAVLKSGGLDSPIMPGTLFFTFPGQVYSLEGDNGFTYLYISFNGPDAPPLLQKFCVSKESAVFPGLEILLDFWMNSIRRVNDQNASTLTESVLLYSLSFLGPEAKKRPEPADRFEDIIRYIHNRYTDSGLTLGSVADIFFYNKKYLSALFVKRTGTHFTEYIHNLRIRHAEYLLEKNSDLSVSELASRCGYEDPFYFSRVFRKLTGSTPTGFLRARRAAYSRTAQHG